MYQIYALLSLMVMTWAAAIWASFDEPTGAAKPGIQRPDPAAGA